MRRREQPARFGAVITAMVTPFDADGALHLDAAVSLARWLVDHGSDGLVVAGTTGEGPTLSDDERLALWRAVAEAVTVPVIANAGSNDTRHSIEQAVKATEAGVDGVLVVTPYYNRPPQAGITEHFVAVARATHLPVLIYDIPMRTGRQLENSTILDAAAQAPNIVGVKDASSDLRKSAALAAAAHDGFELYSGEDALTLPLLSVGAVGAIAVESHWAGVEVGEMIGAFMKGDVDGAAQVNARLLESHAFQSSDAAPNPIPVKAACRCLGLPVGQCRLPLGNAPAGLEAEARRLLVRLGHTVA
jgi:4-hydroxy-tetrahydrodipicolinate synthase